MSDFSQHILNEIDKVGDKIDRDLGRGKPRLLLLGDNALRSLIRNDINWFKENILPIITYVNEEHKKRIQKILDEFGIEGNLK